MHIHLRSPQELHLQMSSATWHTYLWPPQRIHRKRHLRAKRTINFEASTDNSAKKGPPHYRHTHLRPPSAKGTPEKKRLPRERNTHLIPLSAKGYTKTKVVSENETPIRLQRVHQNENPPRERNTHLRNPSAKGTPEQLFSAKTKHPSEASVCKWYTKTKVDRKRNIHLRPPQRTAHPFEVYAHSIQRNTPCELCTHTGLCDR